MRIRKKSLLGKLAIATVTIVLVLMLIRKQDGGVEFGQSSLGSFRLPRLIQNPLDSTVDIGARFVNVVQKCLSSVELLKITANFTMNTVLDNLVINYSPRDRSKTAVVEGSVPDSEPLQIVVIPHSHNDPGWKKTYQKYFDDQTTHILSHLVDKLDQYPDMTFVWVESCFLDKWWGNQTTETQNRFRELVESGRLEITSGMWVAPDEASPHYFALVDQLIEGHYWVKQNLKVVPESSLNFDQFGYSATMPYLVKKAGLKNVLIKRIHRAVKELFGEQNKMNFHWRQFWDPTGKDDIFAHVDTYEWMSISDSCGPDRAVCRGLDFASMPDLPDPKSPQAAQPMRADFRGHSRVNDFDTFARNLVAQFRLKNANYKYRVMMLPHGGDFRYDKTLEWDKQYRNLKVFMKYVNEKKEFNVKMKFGTLKDYFYEIDKQNMKYNIEFPVVSGDFYTYTENADYWTGYFTTRQFDKRLSRQVLENLRAAEMFASIFLNSDKGKLISENVKVAILRNLVNARQNLGVFQHHDAITGTSQAHVAADYEKMLSSAFNSTQIVLSLVIQQLLSFNSGDYLHPSLKRPVHDRLTQEVAIPISSDTTTNVVLVNSLPQYRKEVVTISSESSQINIYDPSSKPLNFDINLNQGGHLDISFIAELPPVSLVTYRVIGVSQTEANQYGRMVLSKNDRDNYGTYFCENEILNVTFSPTSGSPSQVCYKKGDYCSKVLLDWRYYQGHGGAYTMMSGGQNVPASKAVPRVSFIKGNYTCGVKAEYDFFSSYVNIPVVKAATGSALRVDVMSDITQTSNFVGDLAMRVDTTIKSNKVYYVDSNGLQLMGRRFRDNIPFDGNVYPMSAMSVIEDDSYRLTVHSAQPHGVVSRTSGSIDFMLDRLQTRPEMDMPEPVKDNKLTHTEFYIEIVSSKEFEKSQTIESTLPSVNSMFLNDLLQHPIHKLYTTADIDKDKMAVSFLQQPLSCDIAIANIKNLVHSTNVSDGTSLTLFKRAVGCQGNVEDNYCAVSDSLTVRPSELLSDGKSSRISKVTEMYLSHLMAKKVVTHGEEISIQPMDIRTFHIE